MQLDGNLNIKSTPTPTDINPKLTAIIVDYQIEKIFQLRLNTFNQPDIEAQLQMPVM